MNRNYLDRPYTDLDATRFEKTFANYMPVASPSFETKQPTNFQKGDGKIAWKNLKAIVADVADIYHEAHLAGGSNFQVQELGRYVAFRTRTTMIPGPIKSHVGAFRKMGLTVSKKPG